LTTSAAASAVAAKTKLDTNNSQVSPRKALEVMSEADAEEADMITAAAATEEISPLGRMTQQHNQHLEILQGHPIVQRILGEHDDLSMQQKVINLLFLSAAFGYAIYTIFNIDSGMTRGWTAQEQLMRIPLDNWGAYESYLANKPIITKTLINVIIYLLGDWLSQTAFQGKHVLNFDISRTFRNGFIGLCFGPLVHQYYEFSDAILPPENGLVTRLEKIVMDQTIYLTIKCSIYISAVGLLAGEEWATVKQTVKDKIKGVVLTAWKFWPIVHCITYRYVRMRHDVNIC
jgi:protein Mpv17